MVGLSAVVSDCEIDLASAYPDNEEPFAAVARARARSDFPGGPNAECIRPSQRGVGASTGLPISSQCETDTLVFVNQWFSSSQIQDRRRREGLVRHRDLIPPDRSV